MDEWQNEINGSFVMNDGCQTAGPA